MRNSLSLILSLGVLLMVACQKPDNPTPSPTPTPTPSVQKDIVVPSASQSYFTNGVSLSSGITDPAATSGTAQSQTVTFTAPAAWTATVTATKAVDWLTVDPSSGSAGDVSMKVTAQANTGYEERAATVTIKSGDANKSFVVRQSGKSRPVEVSGIALDRTELSMTVGDAVTLVATVSPENATDKSVSWGSSDTAVATVDESGKVTAVSAGSATVTAKAGEKTASCSVTVSAAQETPTPTPTPEPDPTPTPEPPANVPVSSLTLNTTTLSLTEGDAITLIATVNPPNATDKTVTWSSSNPAVATVDQNGKVTAVAAGSATITAQAGDQTATCSVTVSAKVIPVTSVSLDKTSLALTEEDSVTLTATVGPENATDKAVTWSSSNPAVATVDQNGKVTAVAAGSATITAQAGDQTATCSVTVSAKVIPVTSVSLDRTSLALTEEDSVTLTATVGPENATDKTVTWSSSNPAVATVDQNGKVTAVAAGSATITAQAGDQSATCDVSVQEKIVKMNVAFSISSSLSGRSVSSGMVVGSYVVNAGQTLSSNGNQYDNVQFSYGSSWTSAQDLYWKNKSTGATVYAYAPYDYAANATALTFSTQTDQSNADQFAASDFLWGQASQSTPSESTVNVPLKSVLGEISISLKAGEGFTDATLEAAEVSVKILGVRTAATINLADGTVSASGSAGSVVSFKDGKKFRAIVVPQTIAEGSKLIEVTVNGSSYTQVAGCSVESGKQITFTVEISRSSSGINVKIDDWESDGTDHGGVAQ